MKLLDWTWLFKKAVSICFAVRDGSSKRLGRNEV